MLTGRDGSRLSNRVGQQETGSASQSLKHNPIQLTDS